MGRFVSRSIVVQIVCLAIGLIFLGIVAVGASTYVRLKEDVMQTALMDTERAVRSMAILYEMKVGGTTLASLPRRDRTVTRGGARPPRASASSRV